MPHLLSDHDFVIFILGIIVHYKSKSKKLMLCLYPGKCKGKTKGKCIRIWVEALSYIYPGNDKSNFDPKGVFTTTVNPWIFQ